MRLAADCGQCFRLSAVRLKQEAPDYTRTEGTPVVLAAIGWWLWTILFVVLWVAIAFWPARVADRKGRSFIGYFLLSLLFFPLALILAYVLPYRSAPDD